MKKIISYLILFLFVTSCKSSFLSKKNKNIPMITIKNGRFFKGKSPYYFVGANYWYGPLLASDGRKGKKRLKKELNLLKANGIDNLRVLVGAEGGANDYTVKPALQYEQGKYNKKLLDGLDYFMKEVRKRDMYVVLYLTNNWEWSGGLAQYLNWNGYGDVPIPNLPEYTWDDFMRYTEQFHTCKPCKEALRNHIAYIMRRTNRYTNTKYTEDNTIMSWQIANEPRVFKKQHESHFTEWLNETVELIDSLDRKHLISTGSEGAAGNLKDINRFERTHVNPKIDYLTAHMWPKNWSWYKEGHPEKSLENASKKAKEYIMNHEHLASKLDKPIVISEFGLPRDGESLSPESSTINRDRFYHDIFLMLENSYKKGGNLSGFNFWGFGGYGKASLQNPNRKWEVGDDFLADPPQEPQGLNTVFSNDSTTLNVIKDFNRRVGNLK